MNSIHKLVAEARERLRAAGIPGDDADLDARLLAQEALGWDTARFHAHGDEPSPTGFAARFDALVMRRSGREPLAYIVGRREFWNLTFDVSPAVLIPRPETELLVEAALEQLAPGSRAHVADICTGSGCIAVALAHARPNIEVTAVDVSPDALGIAQRNAERYAVTGRVRVVPGDLLAKTATLFDLIVCNPPYVPTTDYASLQAEVRSYEPPVALFGGRDGLEIIRRLVDESVTHLVPGGTLLMEFGLGQADAVSQLISSTPGLRMVALRRDLRGILRIAIAERHQDTHHG